MKILRGVTLLLFVICFSTKFSAIAFAQNPPCTIKLSADYDCNGTVDLNDFDRWKADVREGVSSITVFELWRRIFFHSPQQTTPTPTTTQETPVPGIPTPTPTSMQPTTAQSTPTPTPSTGGQDVIRDSIGKVSISRLTDVITNLADDDDTPGVDSTQTRWSTSDGNRVEREYIKRTLEAHGVSVSLQDFTGTSKFSGASITSKNIIGEVQGKDTSKYYIVTAHMDSTAARTGSNDPAPGADDNGSGTAVVVETAAILSGMKDKLNSSFLFILFSGEEQGLLGSEYYAGHFIDPSKIKGVINMDMIGWNPEGRTDCVQFGYIARNGGKVLSDMAESVDSTYSVGLQAKSVLTNIWASDHYSFTKRNIPAVLVSECILMETETGTSQPHYHSNTDIPSTIRFTQVEKTAKVIVGTLLKFGL